MKRTKKHYKKSKVKFGYIFLILVFVIGITFVTLSLFMPKKMKIEEDNDDPVSTAINQTEKEQQERQSDAEKIAKQPSNDDPEKTPKQYEAEKTQSKEKIDSEIAINEVADGIYTLQVSIYELLNEGSCKLHMESANGDMVDRTAKIVSIGPDSSSCDGFEIPTSGIAPGNYNFVITMTSGTKSGSLKGTIKI